MAMGSQSGSSEVALDSKNELVRRTAGISMKGESQHEKHHCCKNEDAQGGLNVMCAALREQPSLVLMIARRSN